MPAIAGVLWPPSTFAQVRHWRALLDIGHRGFETSLLPGAGASWLHRGFAPFEGTR